MKNSNQRAIIFRLLSDFLFIIICFYFATDISKRGMNKYDIYFEFILIVAWYYSSKLSYLYEEFRALRFIDEFLILIPNVFSQFVLTVIVQFSLNEHRFQRTFSILYPILLFSSLSVKKYLFKKYYQYLRKNGKNIKQILIIGTDQKALNFWEMINNNTQYGYNVVGFVDDEKSHPEIINDLYQGNVSRLPTILETLKVDEIIVANYNYTPCEIKELICLTDKYAVRTRIIPNYFQFNTHRFKMEMFGDYPLVTVRNEPLEQFHSLVIKRLIDIVFSLGVMVFIFSWLFPIIALLIKIDSKGPIFFLQERWGKGNKSFRCLKFRTMYVHEEFLSEKFQQTTKNDPRITRIGSILRKTNIDEFPQFINVLLGNMSVVGPRPHAVKHNLETKDCIEGYLIRHWAKPGITGWAQANGYRGETKDISLMKSRVDFDIWYIENWTPWLDVKIVGMTIYSMFKGDLMAY
jgi:putative colanic acid biosynthesis UDP-glucose lipid carrier transferase